MTVSDSPQLADTLPAWFWLAAVKKASAKPGSVLGASYTTTFAPGAIAPDCSTSRSVSLEPYPKVGSAGTGPPSMRSSDTLGYVFMPRTFDQKYWGAPWSSGG